MPKYEHDWSDQISQLSFSTAEAKAPDLASALKQRADRLSWAGRTYTRRVASFTEVSRFERAQGWPAYIGDDAMRRMFILWGKGDEAMRGWCIAREISPSIGVKKAMKGAEIVASGLNSDGVAVW